MRPKARPGPPGTDVVGGRYGHPGYAIPRQPIRVLLARDEEAAGIESETTKLKPPAYGLWRQSVVSFPSAEPTTRRLFFMNFPLLTASVNSA